MKPADNIEALIKQGVSIHKLMKQGESIVLQLARKKFTTDESSEAGRRMMDEVLKMLAELAHVKVICEDRYTKACVLSLCSSVALLGTLGLWAGGSLSALPAALLVTITAFSATFFANRAFRYSAFLGE